MPIIESRNATSELPRGADVSSESVGTPPFKGKFRKVQATASNRKTNGKKGKRKSLNPGKPGHSQTSETSSRASSRKSTKKTKGSNAVEPEVKAEKPERKRIHRFERNWLIDDALRVVLEQRFPNHNFVVRKGEVVQHPHTLSAIERAITEEMMYDTLVRHHQCGQITDVGGNAMRHLQSKRSRVHSCCPILGPKDVLRNQRYTQNMSYCVERAEECDVAADGYMAVHSLYYLKPSTVIDLLYRSAKGVFMATMHDFANGYGSMHFNGTTHETTYQIIDTTTVLMTSLGNDGGPYKHSPCFWLQKNYYEANGRAMAWGFRQVGDTRIYTFAKAPCGLEPTIGQSMDLIASIKNDSYTGPIKDTSYAPLMNYLNLETVEFKSFGPLIWVNKNDRQIFVPKGLIQRVAFQIVGKPRTRDSLKLCIRDTKKELSDKSLVLPDSLRTELAVVVPPLAFLLHLEDEIQSFNKLLLPINQVMYSKMNNALNLIAPAICCFSSRRTHDSESTLAVDEYNSTRTSVSVVKEKIGKGFQFLSTTAKNVVQSTRRGAYVKVDEAQEPKEDTPLLAQVATTFSGHIPIVPTSTQSNTLLAIQNRVVVEVVPPVKGHWEKMDKRFRAKKYIDYSQFDFEPDLDVAFTKWNEKFPPGRKKEHVAAYNHLKENSMVVKNYYRKLFIKREKLAKSSPDGLEPFNPRAISGVSHEANVLLGPFMSQYSKLLAKQWNGTGVFFYTSGASQAEAGAWMYDNYHPGDLLMEVDFKQYDSTQGEAAHNIEREDYIEAGVLDYPGAIEVIDHQKHMRGFSNDGIEYFVSFGRNSGDSNTSCGNTKHTVSTTEYVVTKVFGEGDYKIKAMGDDNITIIPAALANGRDLEETRFRVIAEYAKFGLVAKVKFHHSPIKAEFCSATYWPAKVNGVETYVMGPKPGRLLPKMGFAIKNLSPGEVKGMFKGYQASCSHVPILSTYIEMMLAKMTHVKELHYYDKESQYKFLPTEGVTASPDLGVAFMARYGLDLETTTASFRRLLAESSLDDMVEFPLLEVLHNVDV